MIQYSPQLATETFLRIEAIFHEALETPPESRRALIRERCAGDAAMIVEVEALLAASEEEEHLTASRRREMSAELGTELDRADGAPVAERQIGPYRLDRLLGRGGMGAVYLAHRADGQFEQQVAIKLIDLPLATDFFRERFRLERQILAGLQHPYIARLLDGGVSADGDLYLAMEYVQGTPIHRFCEAQKLSIAQRLRLFKKVCEAVQFAHQNLVVHRDLKPDNIFVAEDGTPRLLDFGTAKLVSPSREKDEGDLTRQGFQSFTPQYASPEQVLGQPITTASDTYSLGVLLQLLLTGVMPYELKELSTGEMLRVICTDPPRRPGNAVGTDRRLDPDLEAILEKALRKEPGERYRTVEQFAADVQDFLDGQPVGARRGTFRYRAQKFIRRNRVGIAAAALLAATLAAGVAGVLWQAQVANQQRRKAEARSADLRQLSNSLLSELDEAIQQLPGSTGVQKLLVTRVLEHLDRMAQDAQGDRLTQLDLVTAYTRLGNLQGNGYDQNLGDPSGAMVSLGKALAIAQPLVAANPGDRDSILALAKVQQSRSEILWQSRELSEAVAAMQVALSNYGTLLSRPDVTPALIGEAAGAMGTLGDEYGAPGTPSLGDRVAALDAYRKTIELDNRALAIDAHFLRCRRGLAVMAMKIGQIEVESDPEQAIRDYEAALKRVDDLPEKDKEAFPQVRLRTMIVRKEANALEELGRYPEAHALFAQVLPLEQKFVDQDPQDLRALTDLEVILDDEAGTYDDEAGTLAASTESSKEARRKNLSASRRLYAETAAIYERMIKLDPTNKNLKGALGFAEVKAGTMGVQLHEGDDPAAMARRGMTAMREAAAKPDASAMILDFATTAALTAEPVELRDPAFALLCAQRLVEAGHRKTASSLQMLAEAERANGRIHEAQAAAREGLGLLPPYRAGEAKSRVRKLLESQLQP